VKAAHRDAKRKAAAERRRLLIEGEPGSLVTKEERTKIWDMLKARGVSDVQAVATLARFVAQCEAQRQEERRLVKPVNGQGLLVPGGRMIISPDEARQQAMPQ
jgi:hypothetical protein